jgi:uncharacterized protein YndB with AHSA1/START domain
VRLTRRYDASPAEVWRALTEPESLARWLARPRALDLSPGQVFELELPNDARIAGCVREVEPERVLEVDWRAPGEDGSIVRFELARDGGGTIVTLDHRLIVERLGMRYMARWTRALRRFNMEVSR